MSPVQVCRQVLLFHSLHTLGRLGVILWGDPVRHPLPALLAHSILFVRRAAPHHRVPRLSPPSLWVR